MQVVATFSHHRDDLSASYSNTAHAATTNKLRSISLPLCPEACPTNQRRRHRLASLSRSLPFFRLQLRYSEKSTPEFCLTGCGQPAFKQPPVSAALVWRCGWSERSKLSVQQWSFGKLSQRRNAPLHLITSKQRLAVTNQRVQMLAEGENKNRRSMRLCFGPPKTPTRPHHHHHVSQSSFGAQPPSVRVVVLWCRPQWCHHRGNSHHGSARSSRRARLEPPGPSLCVHHLGLSCGRKKEKRKKSSCYWPFRINKVPPLDLWTHLWPAFNKCMFLMLQNAPTAS